MTDSCGGGDGGDDSVEGFVGAELFFGKAPLGEVFGLVCPFLEVDVPELIEVDSGIAGVEEVFDVGNGRFAGGVDVAVDVLFVASMSDCGSPKAEWGWTYSAAVCGVDAVDHIDSEIMLVGHPGNDFMAVLCHCADDGVYSPKDWWVRENLYFVSDYKARKNQ